MKRSTATPPRRTAKEKRLHNVLLGLVNHFIRTGKPVGSQSLQESEFRHLSSATLRNYFGEMEQSGLLHQLHSSGGRIPTPEAYRIYAKEKLEDARSAPLPTEILHELRQGQTREIARYLQMAAEQLSKVTQLAVILSAPRFDHDFVSDIKVVLLDPFRCLVVLVTDFGLIHTVSLHSEEKLTQFSAKRLEAYFQWRLTGHDKPDTLDENEEQLGQEFYNEVMLRHIVSYSNFPEEDVYRTGFSRLLNYPEYIDDTQRLGRTLSLFENTQSMRLLLRECASLNQVKYWIGDDLPKHGEESVDAAFVTTPYRIHQTPVGAVGVLGPSRIPYDYLFAVMRRFADYVSETLTSSVYKFHISYRQPQAQTLYLPEEERLLIEQSTKKLLENKS